jgi:Thioesterase-like superfamily
MFPVDLPAALYVPASDGTYTATALTVGPWSADLQHAGPPAALLAREAERAGGIAGAQTVRLAYDIFAPVPVGPVRVRAHVVRPGRRIELVEATLDDGGDRPLMRLSAWRVRVRDDAPGGASELPVCIPAPEESRPEVAAFFTQEVAYHRALDWRFAAGTFNAPGPAAAWTRPACALVEGEPITPLQHLLVMTDAASGISTELDWRSTSFANVDLTLALHRPPAGEWLGMDARTTLGGLGAAQCFADLYDTRGRIGRSSQSLFVEPR